MPLWWNKKRNEYGSLPKCMTLYFENLTEADRLLRDKRALDSCYRANAELMRRGASMYRRYTNPYLVKDILRGL